MDLAPAVAATTLARQRTLPVAEPLIPLLPEGGLVRGRAVSCRGVAATSLALALAVEATTSGAWVAVVDVPWLGVEAAAELGIPLERLVRIDPGAAGWADLVAAALDGFEVVITRVPSRLDAGTLRRVQHRVQAREAVLLAVGQSGRRAPELTIEASTPRGAACAAVGSPSRPAAGGGPARAGSTCGCRDRTARWPRPPSPWRRSSPSSCAPWGSRALRDGVVL